MVKAIFLIIGIIIIIWGFYILCNIQSDIMKRIKQDVKKEVERQNSIYEEDIKFKKAV